MVNVQGDQSVPMISVSAVKPSFGLFNGPRLEQAGNVKGAGIGRSSNKNGAGKLAGATKILQARAL